jgi:hypothetical protein
LEAILGSRKPLTEAEQRRKQRRLEKFQEQIERRRERQRHQQKERRALAAGLVTAQRQGIFRLLLPVKRTCAQCGAEFQPQRTTAKFCSPKCRVYWHREKGCYAK